MAHISDGQWDLSHEREFLEGILCQRFNFLLVFYSLVLAGAFTTQSQLNFNLALTLGAVVTALFAMPIARVQRRLDCVLSEIERNPEHPVTKTNRWASEVVGVPWIVRPLVRKSRRRMIGYWIPLLCAASLWAGAICAWTEVLKPK